MKADLSKLYDTLTLEERFRLRAQAWARGDHADMERLDRTCPLAQYGAYCARLEAGCVLVLGVLAELLPKLAKLRMVSAVRPLVAYLEQVAEEGAEMAYFDGYAAGWRAAGKRSKRPEIDHEKLSRKVKSTGRSIPQFSAVLDELEATLAASARTPRDGLAALCNDEMGLSLEVALGAWGRPALAELAVHAELLDAAEPDADELELFAKVLGIAWRREGLNDPTAEFDDDLREAIEAAYREGA